MKKIGIVTLYGEINYGNKLQNYAVQELLSKYGYAETIRYFYKRDFWKIIPHYIKLVLKFIFNPFISLKNIIRENKFKNFSKNNLNITKFYNLKNIGKDLGNKYDCFFVGSDQVWNHEKNIDPFFLLDFADDCKKNSFSASISRETIESSAKNAAKKAWLSFNSISVREYNSKILIEQLTNRDDVVELLDPTMLVDLDVWNRIAKKPKLMNSDAWKNKKYILNYFLGFLPSSTKELIYKIANDNNCYVINILDPYDPFYTSDPSEFIWLEKNAFLICTDSFHSSVFAILYERPFIVFNREDGQLGINSMNSRIVNLLKKFNLEDRYYQGNFNNNMLTFNNKNIKKILLFEKNKLTIFLSNIFESNNKGL